MRNTKLSRRRFMAALGLGTAALWLGGCGPAGSAPDDASSQAPASSLPEEAEAEPFLTPEEFPGVDGSTACIPLIAQMMADAAGVPLEEAQSSVTVSTTAYAWENMGVYGSSDIGLLVVYCLKDAVFTGWHGLPELLAIVFTAALHKWKKNTLLSIAGGTIAYMILVQNLFR